MKQHLEVVGAAIVRDGKLLALRRRNGIDSVIHKFEFVGGKVEEGETHEQALKRECREELSLDIEVGDCLTTVGYSYPEYNITLSVYVCKMLSGYTLSEHEEERWIDSRQLTPEEWVPADSKFLGILKTGYVRFKDVKTEEDFALIGAKDGRNGNYTYKTVWLNGEYAGYYAYSRASCFDAQISGGTYLAEMNLKEFARNRKVSEKAVDTLPRPVYLTVNKDAADVIRGCKNYGFRVVSVVDGADGGKEFVMELK